MTPELTEAFTVIVAVTIMAIVVSPILVWILPNRTRSV